MSELTPLVVKLMQEDKNLIGAVLLCVCIDVEELEAVSEDRPLDVFRLIKHISLCKKRIKETLEDPKSSIDRANNVLELQEAAASGMVMVSKIEELR